MQISKKVLYSEKFYSGQWQKSNESAKHAVPLLMDLINPESVVDVGCGIGSWIAEFRLKGVDDALGIDGSWAAQSGLIIPQENFVASELSQSAINGVIDGVDRTFSLCCSLEVAEHLPKECADGFVKLLALLSKVVVFSAAIPYQGGTNHVNEQWPDYWIEKFQKLNYIPSDILRLAFWGNKNILPWYRQNIILFIEKNNYEHYRNRISCFKKSCSKNYHSMVHPDFYLMCHDYYHSQEYLLSYKLSTLMFICGRKIKQNIRKVIRFVTKGFR